VAWLHLVTRWLRHPEPARQRCTVQALCLIVALTVGDAAAGTRRRRATSAFGVTDLIDKELPHFLAADDEHRPLRGLAR
jgi:hypothetical protein